GGIPWAARRPFEALARDRPLIVAIDDLHWAEQALLDLVEQLDELARAPLLVIGLARPEALDARPRWPGSILRLERLPEADATRLIGEVIGGARRQGHGRGRV